MDIFRLPIFDVRLLGAIAVALITLATLANPEPAPKLARPQVVRGEHGVQITSFAFSPTGKSDRDHQHGRPLNSPASEDGWQIERFLDFPGYATAVAFSPDGRSLAAVGTRARHLPLEPDVPDEPAQPRSWRSDPAGHAHVVLARRQVPRRHDGP